MQQRHPDLELLDGEELGKGEAATESLRTSLLPLADVVSYQVVAKAHGIDVALEAAWPSLLYEHAVLRGRFTFFVAWRQRVSTVQSVTLEALARLHMRRAGQRGEAGGAGEKYEAFLRQVEDAGMLDASQQLRDASNLDVLQTNGRF